MSERILEGALRAVGQHGVGTLSMREISEAAGVSRGTIYRYYKNREELLKAAASYDRRRFEAGAVKAMESMEPGEVQLRALLDYSYRFLLEHPSRWMVEIEPAFVLRYLDDHLPQVVEALAENLRMTLDSSSAVRYGLATSDELANLIVRLIISMYLVPGRDSDASLDAISALVTGGHDRPRRPSEPRTARKRHRR